jgi:20S proteasome alpha/beta subunit
VVNRFGPLGNIEQIDYAQAAVDRSSAIAAVAAKDGMAVVFGWLQQKDELLDEEVPLPRVIRLSPTLAAITTGLQGDCRLMQRYMVEDVAEFCSIFGMDPDADYVANSLARRLQDRTMSSQRPLAAHVLVGSVHSSHPAQLFSVTLAGQATQVKGYCAGQGQEHGLQAMQQPFHAHPIARSSGSSSSSSSSSGEEDDAAVRVLQKALQAMSRNATTSAGVAYEIQRFMLKPQT